MKTKQLFIGIDVSKGYSDFNILTGEKEVFGKAFQLDDTQNGHQILKEKLEELTSKGYQIVCGVENTGGYEHNWVKAVKTLSMTNEKIEIYKLSQSC